MKIKFMVYMLVFGLGFGMGIACSYIYFTINCHAIALNLSGIVSNLKETKDPALKQEKLDFIYSKIRFTLAVDYWAGVSGELKKMSCTSEPWMDEEN